MNSDEIDALLTKIVIAAAGSWLGAHGFDVTQLQGAIGAVGTLAGIGYGVWKHWNMRKVPETATVTLIPRPAKP
jgi:hypothetical protein